LVAGDLFAVTEVLQLIGVFVSLSIAYVASKGLRQTQSPALLRLTTAFLFLGFGFVIQTIVGLDGVIPILPALTTTMVASLAVAGTLMETAGYFFLAFSHALDVILSKRFGTALLVFPIISLSITQTTDTLSILSFYFILYGIVETLAAYSRNKRPDTLLIATGLALLGVSAFMPWLLQMYPEVYLLSLIQIIIKEIGLMILFIPVLNYALGGAKLGGPV